MHSLRPPRFSLRSQPARLDAPAATVPGRAAPSDSVPVLQCWLPCPLSILPSVAMPLPTSPHRRWRRQACSKAPATLPPPSAPDPCSAVTHPSHALPCQLVCTAPRGSRASGFISDVSQPVNGHRLCKHRQTDRQTAVVHPSLLQPPATCAPLGASPAPLGAPAGNTSAWGTGTSEQLASKAGSAAAHLHGPSGAAAGGALGSRAAEGSRKAAMTAPRATASPR